MACAEGKRLSSPLPPAVRPRRSPQGSIRSLSGSVLRTTLRTRLRMIGDLPLAVLCVLRSVLDFLPERMAGFEIAFCHCGL